MLFEFCVILEGGGHQVSKWLAASSLTQAVDAVNTFTETFLMEYSVDRAIVDVKIIFDRPNFIRASKREYR